MKRVHGGIVITLLVVCFSSHSLFAVDEEYFIPYTDNYGYEYDAESGTYIKNETQATSESKIQQSTPIVSNTPVANNPVNPTENTSPADNQITTSPSPIVLAAIILLFGVTVVLVKIVNKSKKPD
ncbi:MAG: hypothetical protein ACI9XC_000320 [Gammaproteobacteria bacterium]|jgi:hypothetical protein